MGSEYLHVTSEDPGFAMVPYWLLQAMSHPDPARRISHDAVALYAVLRKYANNETGDAYPSRATLAHDMGYKDPKSLSKPIRELETIGALEVARRRLEHAVNHYRVVFQKPSSAGPTVEPQHVVQVGEENPLPPVGEETPPPTTGRGTQPPRVGEETPVRVGEETPHELDPYLTRPKELQADALFEVETSTAIAVPGTAQEIAKAAFDGSQGALPFMGMRQIAEHYIKRGYPAPHITQAMEQLWTGGRAVTRQTVGQVLQGIVTPGAAPKSRTARSIEASLARAKALEAQGR